MAIPSSILWKSRGLIDQRHCSLREQVQPLFHLTDGSVFPVARSTYSDALNSKTRLEVQRPCVEKLINLAGSQLPDRFNNIIELGERPIYAADGTYQKASAHYRQRTPRQGGEDNPKGHMMLTLYNMRLGVPIDVAIETNGDYPLEIKFSD